ncbi:hypothetical protein H6G33_15765 [Calothrix sp. FACHB-1219]|uniref:hypothetical protein n=1 Tax=unclassified Calothrix TaxID=2619626 RepID=UPI001684A86F|nr:MULTISPECIES: hypothetical protein [unclassified Calothrix]MBD2205361.1 hypothetical protein [Calothrix sp. FACHB-168]MBD2218492.1 hypothetical protein [Calothrix sp. FACHB-1219]
MLNFAYSSIALGLALLCLAITPKINNSLGQILALLFATFWLCSSLFFSLIPIELILAIALFYLTPKAHFWSRIK